MNLSISRIKAFKSCRRLYELKYIENLVPVQQPETLEIGKSYHSLLERLNGGENLAGNPEYSGDYSKEMAMARAYERYIFPQINVAEAEKRLEMDLVNGDRLVGIVDGIAKDGHIVEHKTTSQEITEAYEYGLLWDEQILAYMLMTGKRKVWYTVCRKPTIRQRQNETDEAFFYRMLDWYDEGADSKIRLLEIERTDEEVDAFHGDLLRMADEMRHTGYFYRNTCHCEKYGRRCEYSSICLNYDPEIPCIAFTHREEQFNEIEI